MKKWRFAVDRGGTFTDVVGVDPAGEFHYLKLLSSSPEYKDASIEGIRRLLKIADGALLPEDMIEGIRFGTTVATNALLERKGNNVLLLITKGLSGILDIGYQNRQDLFKLCVKKPPPLYSAIMEIDERIDSGGNVLKGLDVKELIKKLKEINLTGIDSIAVVLMHSWTNPAHELMCEKILIDNGLVNVFLSHKAVNSIKIVSRGQSTVIDAYLSLVIQDYLKDIKDQIGNIHFEFIESSGSLNMPEFFTGKNALLSGPAGGVIATAHIANELGLKGVIGLDMGGTSTDVSRFDGNFEKIYEKIIEGIPIQTEMLNIETVAAGGGSIAGFDGQKLIAGPESAGSYPGPACYGFGGPITITDANLVTGRLVPEYFPKTFGQDRKSPLKTSIVKEKFSELANYINKTLKADFSPYEIAEGFLKIANEKMARAIKKISVAKGFDVRDYGLVCFGGAGGQHVCAIASLLEIEKIIIHPLSSVMSAYGIGLSCSSKKYSKTLLIPYNIVTDAQISQIFEKEESIFLSQNNFSYSIIREIDLRPKGADAYITLPYHNFQNNVDAFRSQYKRLFGFENQIEDIEAVNIRIEFQNTSEFFMKYAGDVKANTASLPEPVLYKDVFYANRMHKAPVYLSGTIPTAFGIDGPAFIIDNNLTVLLDTGFNAEIDKTGLIIIKRMKVNSSSKVKIRKTAPDPVLLEIFNNLFMNAAEEMGIVLQKAAHSVNIKERLDFSCAIFDSAGDLVANAPHIPVHLGSMADTVKAIYTENRDTMKSGDIYLTNNPYKGGSHLPDLTIICPVYSDSSKPLFFTSNRGHHSDIGGNIPGSMPSSAKHIDEEGLLIDNFLIVRDGHFKENELRNMMSFSQHPVRNIDERIADLKAQIAACKKGESEILSIIGRYGDKTVADYMKYIQDNAEYLIKTVLHRLLGSKDYFHSSFEDYLDDGTLIKASITIEAGTDAPQTIKALIDFAGTGQQHTDDNLNAPFSVVNSAVMYVLRSLIDSDIPLNSGCLKPISIRVPDGTILNPVYPAPVASGNVETSQRIVDVLLGCLQIAAASQGTMNNLIFGVDGESPYYETIAGGSGALGGCHGASGIHVHMTNTRLTDPEILERRHPGILIKRFEIRRGSGGLGKFNGGDGVIREIKFLKSAIVSILSERRVYAPYGIKGGENGAKGLNIHKKANGESKILSHRETLSINKGDSIVIETPGGGGYGEIKKED